MVLVLYCTVATSAAVQPKKEIRIHSHIEYIYRHVSTHTLSHISCRYEGESQWVHAHTYIYSFRTIFVWFVVIVVFHLYFLVCVFDTGLSCENRFRKRYIEPHVVATMTTTLLCVLRDVCFIFSQSTLSIRALCILAAYLPH